MRAVPWETLGADTIRAMNQKLFQPIVPEEAMSESFFGVMITAGHRPAREIMEQLFERLPNPDGNFVKDFQTKGFDARLWELYIFALALERGWNPERPHDMPDYRLTSGTAEVWLEAVTANPTQGREPTDTGGLDIDGLQDYAENVLPMKLGSPLASKLTKKYWQLPHVTGKPLVVAIADFHDPDPARWNEYGLACYLYGLKPRQTSAPGEVVTATFEPIVEHRAGQKVIPSGFFNLPDARYVSAVLFTNAGTIAKFSRMAYDSARYPDLVMIRWGFASDPDPRAALPLPFGYVVGEVVETWGEGVTIFHNPHAIHKIDHAFFEGLTQRWLSERGLEDRVSAFHPFMSQTSIFQTRDGAALSNDFRGPIVEHLTEILARLKQQVAGA